MITWLIGLSGSGKTTVGRCLFNSLKDLKPNSVFIDGDEIREVFKHNRGSAPYTIEGRRQNAERIQALCKWLDNQGINVVCCILSIFEESREWNRENYSDYFEVFVDTPMEVLKTRREMYVRAERGETDNVVGMDIPFPPPKAPNLVIDGSGNGNNPQQSASLIVSYIKERLV
ncbi:adenylyl-sulfate kinase [Rheinheimera maricola]|uniref:Adenylyl-sulfate kinase n=1 Tax=Rheinheimera maricola TaxID=2793282 RepID=A0ABS7X557_9GAMM|nr:adenylyl-sulfate kinase [Rheinheimera maricola]MBZ9610319.1 adenylyl-sulfate kinase [Rheinheimera maricola]